MVACDDLDNYDKNGRSGKKKPLTLVDAELVHPQYCVFLIFSSESYFGVFLIFNVFAVVTS